MGTKGDVSRQHDLSESSWRYDNISTMKARAPLAPSPPAAPSPAPLGQVPGSACSPRERRSGLVRSATLGCGFEYKRACWARV